MAAPRTGELGRVGELLEQVARADRRRLKAFGAMSKTAKMVSLSKSGSSVGVSNALMPAALSMLYAPYPVQVEVSDDAVLAMAMWAFPGYGEAIVRGKAGLGKYARLFRTCAGFDFPNQPDLVAGRRPSPPPASLRTARDIDAWCLGFPYKSAGPARAKANLHLSGVLRGLRASPYKIRGLALLARLWGRGLTNDQAVSAILLLPALDSAGYPAPEVLAAEVVASGGDKGLSTVLKSLGCNCTHFGSVLVETNTLAGRGVGELDLRKVAEERCDPAWVEKSVIHVDQEALGAVVRRILREELGARDIEFNTLEEHWSRRWAWCVNGAHSNLLDRKLVRARVAKTARFYRRMYAEEVNECPLTDWDGEVLVSASPKLEHGKTRAILACDTLSYMAFEHFLRPVEKAWGSYRAILDPGSIGHSGIADRIRRAPTGATHLMLDYDDFNSQHSTASMATVVRETAAYVGYPPELTARLVASLDRHRVHVGGREVGTAAGTLMSGHRATTFFNTVLNEAYIRLAVGEQLYEGCYSMHVGDDVYISVPTHTDVSDILDAVRGMGARMNPVKQSTGRRCAEFLRMAVTHDISQGYVCRAIASIVSGSWVSDNPLANNERLAAVTQGVRSLMNRGRSKAYPDLVAHGIARATGYKLAEVAPILRGWESLNGGPIYHVSGVFRKHTARAPLREEKVFEGLLTYATDAYLHGHAQPVELRVMDELETSVRHAMVASSYAKASFESPEPVKWLPLQHEVFTIRPGAVTVEECLTRRKEEGVLSKYPLLNFLRNSIDSDLLRDVLVEVGVTPSPVDVYSQAWGAESYPHYINGPISYSDAAMLSGRAREGVIIVTRPSYM